MGVRFPFNSEGIFQCLGDTVVIKNLGREPVTVMVDEYDDQGNFVKEQERKTHRNSFIVEVKMKVKNLSVVVPQLKVVGSTDEVHVVDSSRMNNIEIPNAGLQDVQQTASKVIPLFKQDTKPWLLAAKEKMEKQAERRKQYGEKCAAKTLEIWESCLDYYNPKAAPFKRYLDNRNLACRMSKILQ